MSTAKSGEAIKVNVSETALVRVRIANSLLWEVAGSLAVLSQAEAAPWPYQRWARAGRRALTGGPGRELLDWFEKIGRFIPADLTPVPPTAETTLGQALETLRTVDATSVLDILPPGGIDWFAEAVDDYWLRILRPYWTLMRGALTEDLHRRAHILATQGAEALVADLDGRSQWNAGVLASPGIDAGTSVECTRQLVLVPLFFGRRAQCVSAGDGVVAVSIQARGAAVIDAESATRTSNGASQPEDRLGILVGRSRAAVLRALTPPTTTSALAKELGLSNSTVSEHLTALVATGLATRRRAGKRVLYELDDAGRALLSYFEGPP